MQKLGLPPLGIASALEETKKLGQEAARSGKKFNALGTFIGKIGKNLAKSLTPINVLTAAMTVFCKYNYFWVFWTRSCFKY